MIKGRVLDSKTGEALAFANVYISNSSGSPQGNIGTITDIDGNYTLLSAIPGQFVTASYVGYTKITRKVTGVTENYLLEGGTTLPEFEITATRVKKTAVFAVFGLALLVSLKP